MPAGGGEPVIVHGDPGIFGPEAKGRVARRTGRTAAGIHAEEAHDGNGYVVVATNEHAPLAPVMLEFGTRYMSRREFFFASARIEEGAHERRVFEAVQTEINEKGLGD